jgi:hypothetical protein
MLVTVGTQESALSGVKLMRARLRRALTFAAVCAGALACWGGSVASATPTWSAAAAQGAQELIGTGDGSAVAWNPATGQWGGQTATHWWQSALAIMTLVRYAERTHDSSPVIQRVLLRTYELNRWQSGPDRQSNFTDRFMDDTAWWGLAWLAASQYELYDRGDRPDASTFLAVAEADASYIASRPRPCGGVEWALQSAPDTITDAEFVALTAGLARYRNASGVFHDPKLGSRWLSEASAILGWLERSGLVDLAAGTVANNLGNSACLLHGGPITYTEGEVADALVQVGEALRDPSYYQQAAAFLRYAISPASGLTFNGVLQDQCEAQSPNCAGNANRLDVTAFKGIFMQAVSDWSAATGSTEFGSFVGAQAAAIVSNDIWGASPQAPGCSSPHSCQFGLSWARPLPSMLVTVGTQESALAALTTALP